MTLRSTSCLNRSDEQGMFLVLVALALAAIMAIVALAIDCGRFYIARIGAQNAADAGAFAGAGMLAVFDMWGETQDPDPVKRASALQRLDNLVVQAEQGARDIARLNLRKRGINPVQLDADYDRGANRMFVDVQANVPVMIFPWITGGSNQGIRAQARAHISSAVISLIVDRSNSMQCPVDLMLGPTAVACGCFPNCAGTWTGGDDQKIEALRESLVNFVNYFRPDRDRMNLVAYGTGAQVLVPMQSGSSYLRGEIIANIQNLTPKGETNTSDGFLRAYLDVERADQSQQQLLRRVSWVHFADGAPSAARFFPVETVNHRDPERATIGYVENKVINKPWAIYDYTNWSVNLGCTDDLDNDGYVDGIDNCPDVPNADQNPAICRGAADYDNDGLKNSQDPCPGTASNNCPTNPQCKEKRRAVPNVLYGTSPEDPNDLRFWDTYNLDNPDPSPVANADNGWDGAHRIAWSTVSYSNPWWAYDGVIRNLRLVMPDGTVRCVFPSLWNTWPDINDAVHRFGACTGAPEPICNPGWPPATYNDCSRGCCNYWPPSPNVGCTCGAFHWTWHEADHLKFYADVAMLYADTMRNQGGRWYAVGFGKEALRGTDPYQTAASLTERKDYFMGRISNDLCSRDEPPIGGGRYDIPQLRTAQGKDRGSYFKAARKQELIQAFEAIARKIRLNLLQ